MIKLNGKVLHPKDGDIIVIYHDNPKAIIPTMESLALSIRDIGIDCSIIIVEPGFDISLMSEEDKVEFREMLYEQV
jgi:hypothetical protein